MDENSTTPTNSQPIATPAAEQAATPTKRRPLWRRRGLLIGAGAAAVLLLGGVGTAYAIDEFSDDDRDRVQTVSEQNVSDQRIASDAPRATDDSRTNDSRSDDRRDSDDIPLTADEFDRASAAALAEAGGGRVTDVDRDDDGNPSNVYDVDVLLDNGDELEIELDADFRVTYTELDPRD